MPSDAPAETTSATADALVEPSEEVSPHRGALLDAARVLSDFMDGEPLTTRIAAIENALAGQTGEQSLQTLSAAALPKELLASSLLVRQTFGRINDVIHAAAILTVLPVLMAPDEMIEVKPSLAAGNNATQKFDLETSRRVAEFKVAVWKGADALRKRTTFADFARLAMDTTDRQKQLFVVGAEPIHFLEHSESTVRWAMSKAARTLREEFDLRHPDGDMSVSTFRRTAGASVEIIDLTGHLSELGSPPRSS